MRRTQQQVEVHEPPLPLLPLNREEVDSTSSESDGDDNVEAPVAVAPEPPVHSMKTRAKSGIQKHNPRYALFTMKSL